MTRCNCPQCQPVNGDCPAAALRADIENHLDEARDLMRRCKQYFPKQNHDHIAAEISALEGIIERDDSRMKAPHIHPLHDEAGHAAKPAG